MCNRALDFYMAANGYGCELSVTIVFASCFIAEICVLSGRKVTGPMAEEMKIYFL